VFAVIVAAERLGAIACVSSEKKAMVAVITGKRAGAPPVIEFAQLSAEERGAKGRAQRDEVPRTSHGGWKPPSDRGDPIDILQASNKGRLLNLVPLRFGGHE